MAAALAAGCSLAPHGGPGAAGSTLATVQATPASARSSPGNAASPAAFTTFVFPAAATTDPVLVGAGDIAECGSSGATRTAELLDRLGGIVFTAGDDAYVNGSASDFEDCYDPTWGRVNHRTLLPAVGNHEYETPNAAPYFAYFGARAGKAGRGWRSIDVGAWHVIVLNSNCDIVGCGKGSAQLRWLRADLAAHPAACTLAIWHHPRFSSGSHGNDRSVAPFWRALAVAGADLVVNGHEHDYERFAPQTPGGVLDAAHGIRELVVGTGGAHLRKFRTVRPQSRVRLSTFGVVELTLHPTSYTWRFLLTDGTVADTGTTACH